MRLGDLDLNDVVDDGASPKSVSIDKIVCDENYEPRTLINDIALLHLKKPVSFTGRLLVPNLTFRLTTD